MEFSFFPVRTTILLMLPFTFLPIFVHSYTVIVSDSGAPSALVDAPQATHSANGDRARTEPREQEAVHEIMRATGNGWASEIPDVCRGRWHGIECVPDTGGVLHVVSLSFGALSDDTAFPTCDGGGGRPFISPAITRLPHLRTLFFYRCFAGNPQPIPPFLGELGPSIRTLVLRENGHIGPIPNELGNLTRLRVLDLHGNTLNGSIPVHLNRLTGLKSLVLSENKLTGSIPNLTFPLLQSLDLNQNHLVGPIPTGVTKCQSLIKLDLSRNRLSGPVPDSIDSLKNIILMDLSYNNLTSPLPSNLKNLNSLQALILSGNPVSSTVPESIFNGSNELAILAMSSMDLAGPIPESLGKLTSLRVLHLDGNRLSGPVPESLGEANNLNELRLENNELSGRVPFNREMVLRMRRKLRLSNNSGLCYDDENALGDGDLEAISGIGHCGKKKKSEIEVGRKVEEHMWGESTSGNLSPPLFRCSELQIFLLLLVFLML
ncbi:unnamed protein product [Cuscuta campestris]|uniref:Leucine-rich repeat-containing N-terminal plant-type domain-containing protein n=1 Tax=Cuscuta campestris TaxID=132261 RepID=A0A484KVR9_9ASTE|nr:unnamed protein product [Cuscuta campestris]